MQVNKWCDFSKKKMLFAFTIIFLFSINLFDIMLINTLSDEVFVTLIDVIESVNSRRGKLLFRLGNSLS